MTAHVAGTATATMDAVWPYATVTTSAEWVAFLAQYPLTAGDLRFAGPLYVPKSRTLISVLDPAARFQGPGWFDFEEGVPTQARFVGDTVLEFDRYTADRERVEFEVIATPAAAVLGVAPPMPIHHRQLLVSAVAAWILFDKSDDKFLACAQEALRFYRQMLEEHRHRLHRAAARMARLIARQDQVGKRSNVLVTASGIELG